MVAVMTNRPLRFALAANLVFSSLCALALIVAGGEIAWAMGIAPAWLMTALGIGLLGFAAFIGFALARLRIGFALIISVLDILWVVSPPPLIFIHGLLTSTGVLLVCIVAAIVGAFGLLRLAGIRAILSKGVGHGRFRHCNRVASSVEPEKLWPVIRNLGAISRYSAGLSASRLEGGPDPAPGTARVCTNHKGQSWAEDAERLDEDAHLVLLRFRSEAEDFLFPLAELSGGWSVQANPRGGSLVDIWWLAKSKKARLRWLIVALMTMALDRDMPKIVAAMDADAMGTTPPRQTRGASLAYC